MTNNTFNQKMIENITPKDVKYFIGIDTYNEDSSAYCLSRTVGDNIEVILCKTNRNKEEFEEEVKNLKKYFNAVSSDDIKKITKFKRFSDFNISDFQLKSDVILLEQLKEYWRSGER